MKAYKLTDENGRTYGNTYWGPGVTHVASGAGYLCGSGWIHVYSHPLLAAFLNPIHANFENPRLWECEVEGRSKNDCGLKQGWASVTTVREIPMPLITTQQRVRFGILCAYQVCNSTAWIRWAEGWLSGKDRSSNKALVAGNAAALTEAAAESAARAAEEWAEDESATAVLEAAESAQAAAREAGGKINLVEMAERAMEEGRR
ncbi:MAG: hypothetical protein KGH96_23785 [Sphingomonadales bacterium]|nr:hypothetical protein [Sphingomonadales bacterium]